MQKIVPNLWFEYNAEEAVAFYTSVFQNSKTGAILRHPEGGMGPVGSVMVVDFQLEGQDFTAINGGPYAKYSPAISFFVNCGSVEEVDALWSKLSDGGTALMELGAYPFSERYGWLNDKYGVSWQINLGPRDQKIAVAFMFVGDQHGNAEEAMHFWTSLWDHSGIETISRYEPGEMGEEGKVKYALFTLAGLEFVAMESNLDHQFTFTPAVSLLVNCEGQPEIDSLWEKFTAEGEVLQCGWLNDKYGVAWQIVPASLYEMFEDQEKFSRVMSALLEMVKIDEAALWKAHAG